MIRAALLWLVLALPAAAQELPLPMFTSINDFAGVLENDDIRAIDQALIALHDKTGIEGTVVTMTDRARYGGSDGLGRFATRLFNHWGVGDAERDDGFMLLLLVDDRETRIELGEGYPKGFDEIAGQIINNTMLSQFREGDYSEGMRAGTAAVISRIAEPYAAGASPVLQPATSPRNDSRPLHQPNARQVTPDTPRARAEQPAQTWVAYLLPKLVIGFFLFVGGFIGFNALRQKGGNTKCPNCGKRDIVTVETPVRDPQEGGGWRVSQMAVKRICQACGWSEEYRTAHPQILTYATTGAVISATTNALHTPSPWRDFWDSGGGGRRHSDNEHSRRRDNHRDNGRDNDRGGGFGGGSSSGGGASGRW